MTGAVERQKAVTDQAAAAEQHIHCPVLLPEAIAGLHIRADGQYVDGTYGRGGHAQAIIDALGPTGQLWLLDRDPQAIAVARNHFGHDTRVQILHANFASLQRYIAPDSVDGILFDLGVSSPQLDVAARGFSFTKDGPLDMRMNPEEGQSAQDWLARADGDEIADVLWKYGQERHSRRIARAIVATRQVNPLTNTRQLAELICHAQPASHFKIHPATRSFQAIRIHINDELRALHDGLEQAVQALRVGGRLAVISFHSLEDHIVKHFFRRGAKAPPNQRRMPHAPAPFQASLSLVGKAIRPHTNELKHNPRARSAVLRIAEKLHAPGGR